MIFSRKKGGRVSLTNRIFTSVRLGEEVYWSIKRLACEQHRSFNNQVQFILLRYLQGQKDRREFLRAAEEKAGKL